MISGLINGLMNLPWWGFIIAVLILTHITIAGVTIFLHRSQAHKALELHPIVSHFFRFWLWLTTGMVTKEWVAIHRKHHAECENENDPHSPQIYGIKKVLWDGVELYRSESKNQETIERYGRGTPDDWVERNIYSRYSASGIILLFFIDVMLFGVLGITAWAIQMAWIPFFAAGVINGIGHFWGYRNFECPDASRNIVPWAILIGGEELHNNHHTYPNSAKLSVKWWEFDIGWMYISILQFFKLATVKKVAPKLTTIPGKESIDSETLLALFANRFQIMSRYSREVILPVLHEEKRKAGEASRSMFSKAKGLLIRTDMLIDPSSKSHLTKLLDVCHSLQQVYQYRISLQSIWERTASSQKELLEALQEWCRQAEATGIDALREFSNRLKTYVSIPQPAV